MTTLGIVAPSPDHGLVVKRIETGRVCFECGFCCNGVIFADVKLQAGDDPSLLRSRGLPVCGKRFGQPCAAWKDCRCNIYADRPKYCQGFDCLLLKGVKAGEVQFTQALSVVRSTKRQVENVERLLRALGDGNAQLNLRKRFMILSKRLESNELSREQAVLFGELTLAFHDLNERLRASFYDG